MVKTTQEKEQIDEIHQRLTMLKEWESEDEIQNSKFKIQNWILQFHTTRLNILGGLFLQRKRQSRLTAVIILQAKASYLLYNSYNICQSLYA